VTGVRAAQQLERWCENVGLTARSTNIKTSHLSAAFICGFFNISSEILDRAVTLRKAEVHLSGDATSLRS